MSWNKGGNRGPWGSTPGSGQPGGGKPSGGGGNHRDQKDIEDILQRFREALRNSMGGGNGTGGRRNYKPFLFIGLILVGLWLASGIYRVDADEQGVVLRFGEFARESEPGLNYHLPYPVEVAYTPKVTTINREEIGFQSGFNGDRRNLPEESLMLTGDKNLVSVQFEVQWRIKDAMRYLFNLRAPNMVVKPIAETAMREVMGNTPLSLALSDKRQAIAQDTKQLMQQILDEYKTGIEIYQVNLLAVDAPEPVVDAFIDVLSAQQEKETLQNEARKYRDGIIPVAQGQAEKMIKDAQGYKQANVSKAKGEAGRFASIYEEYSQARDVTRKRLYLETMEDVLDGMNKMIIDDKAGNGVTPYLPLPELQNRRTTKKKGE